MGRLTQDKEGEILMKKGLLLLISILLLSACNNNSVTSEQKALREKLIEITQLTGDSELRRKY